MAKYKIDWLQMGKTTTGKEKADATLIDEQGNKVDVTIWGDFPAFNTMMPGAEIEGELKEASNPKWKPSLNAPRTPKTASGSNFKTLQVEKAQERKESSINRTLDRKEESIALMSAQRDATLIVTTFYKEAISSDPILSGEAERIIRKKIVEWRDWYLSNEFTDHLPF